MGSNLQLHYEVFWIDLHWVMIFYPTYFPQWRGGWSRNLCVFCPEFLRRKERFNFNNIAWWGLVKIALVGKTLIPLWPLNMKCFKGQIKNQFSVFVYQATRITWICIFFPSKRVLVWSRALLFYSSQLCRYIWRIYDHECCCWGFHSVTTKLSFPTYSMHGVFFHKILGCNKHFRMKDRRLKCWLLGEDNNSIAANLGNER